ncbi:MAG: 2-isopropylmalate synthase [Gemmatimonadales bacterium]|nr:MAG: 2-isopropylmalate synthase [Gemmatimonadales bacterium]
MGASGLDDLIHDWNVASGAGHGLRPVELDDETLRDGLQSPSVTDPSPEEKVEILHLMEALGIHSADIGLPGAGPRAVADVRLLALEIAREGMAIRPNCAARTMVRDVEPIARISQEAGLPIEASTFIGSSPIRQYAEDWTLDKMLETSEAAVTFAVKEGLPVMFVTEDTTRARPETLRALYGRAIEWGARRLCLADTVGHATPSGVRALVRFVKEEIVAPSGEDVKVDWHGHRDRGLGMANALAAVEAGADRIHGTALGIGERVGNVEMDLLLVNLCLLGLHDGDLGRLPDYCRRVSEATDTPIPPGYPVVGRDAFRTSTGVHAAAIMKAEEKGDAGLADAIYSGVPAARVGREQEIGIGPMSGLSNVRYWLRARGYDAGDEALCRKIFDHAKRSSHTLEDEEVKHLIHGETGTEAG